MSKLVEPNKSVTSALAEQSRRRRRALPGTVSLATVTAGQRRNDLLPTLALEHRPISQLVRPNRKLRRAVIKHVADVAKSITTFGMVAPILIDAHNNVVDGLVRLAAARLLGIKVVPCLVVSHLTAEEVRVLRIAINRLGETGGWELGELKLEFQELLHLGAPLEVTGFTLPEIDQIVMLDEPAFDTKANTAPVPDTDMPPISRLGDMWRLGRHLLLCADATKPESYEQLFADGRSANVVFTDPPYNIAIDGFAVGSGKTHHREFVAASGELSDDEFETFLAQFLAAATDKLVDGGLVFCCMDWRHSEHVQHAARRSKLTQINTVVWNKGQGGLGGIYRSAHEFVLLFKKGKAPSQNNVELGKHGRDRTNVWTYPGANLRGSSANEQLTNHPTPKPVELVADALLDVTRRDDIVLDPFAGSGTTIVAAEKTGRAAYAMELDSIYVDLIIRRFQSFARVDAVHLATGKTYAQLALERNAAAATNPVELVVDENKAEQADPDTRAYNDRTIDAPVAPASITDQALVAGVENSASVPAV